MNKFLICVVPSKNFSFDNNSNFDSNSYFFLNEILSSISPNLSSEYVWMYFWYFSSNSFTFSFSSPVNYIFKVWLISSYLKLILNLMTNAKSKGKLPYTEFLEIPCFKNVYFYIIYCNLSILNFNLWGGKFEKLMMWKSPTKFLFSNRLTISKGNYNYISVICFSSLYTFSIIFESSIHFIDFSVGLN